MMSAQLRGPLWFDGREIRRWDIGRLQMAGE
jgi:hypothetical protein